MGKGYHAMYDSLFPLILTLLDATFHTIIHLSNETKKQRVIKRGLK